MVRSHPGATAGLDACRAHGEPHRAQETGEGSRELAGVGGVGDGGVRDGGVGDGGGVGEWGMGVWGRVGGGGWWGWGSGGWGVGVGWGRAGRRHCREVLAWGRNVKGWQKQ